MTIQKLEDTLCAAAGPRKKDVHVFSYRRDFERLWRSGETFADATTSGDVFILWDGVPHTPSATDAALARFLTIYDWVAAIVLATHASPQRPRAGFDFRVHIIDGPKDLDWGHAPSSMTSTVLDGLLPWVKFYRASETDQCCKAAAEPSTSMPTLKAFCADPAAKADHAATLVRALWTSLLTQAGIRHSLSNAIGPVVLAYAISCQEPPEAILARSARQISLRPTLLSFLKVLGLALNINTRSDRSAALGGLAAELHFEEDLFNQFSKLAFALVDDQAAAGFHDVLAAFLLGPRRKDALDANAGGGDPVLQTRSDDERVTLSSFERPTVLLDWLRHLASDQTKPWYEARVLGERPPGETTPAPFDILFLDLRLYGISGARSETQASKNLQASLVEIFETNRERICHPQSGISASRRVALEQGATAARASVDAKDGESATTQLAFLAILLAVFDPTAPIIIFSSSQQRSVLNVLRPFPNIITTFAKPTITGYQADDRAALAGAIDNLTSALRHALFIHERRLLWSLMRNFDLDRALAPPCILEVKTKNLLISDDACNLTGWPQLPFKLNDFYRRRLFDIVAAFIVDEPSLDHWQKPYELLEAALLHDLRSDPTSSSSVNFTYRAFEARKLAYPVSASHVQAFKEARNQVVHGYLSHIPIPEEGMTFVGTLIFLQMLTAIGDDEVQQRLDEGNQWSAPLVGTLLRERFLDYGDARQPGRRFDDLLKCVWPTLRRTRA